MPSQFSVARHTPPKPRRMNATDLLNEIRIMLQCKDSNLIDLPQDAVIIDTSSEDVSLAHLKCSIAVTAGTRAKKHYEITGKINLEDEDVIKGYLLQVIGVDELDNKALPGLLWLCLHIQRSQFSTEEDHTHYFGMFSEVVKSLETATVEIEFQFILASALEKVSETSFLELDPELTQVLLKTLNIGDVDDLKENLRALKVNAININTAYLPHLEGVMGWSSSGEIFISSGHGIIRDVFNAIKNGDFVTLAKLIIESLVLREGGHCVARKRARECGSDPTLFSTPSPGLNNSTSTSKCNSVNQCGRESGYILETIVFGAALDPVALWVARWKFPPVERLPLHGLCRWCKVPGSESVAFPITESKSVPALGFSCTGRLRAFR
jgi:hypothetical protein